MAEIIRENDPQVLDIAVRLLREGELVGYPTDTLYGLGAAAGDDAAVRRVFSAKGRPPSRALPLLVSDGVMATGVAEISPLGNQLVSAFWPGALTIVMKKAPRFHSLALAGGGTVALRAPAHGLVRDIIRALGQPITGTSANRSGGRPPSSAAEIAFQMGDMVALVIDGGPPARGVESTIVDIAGGDGLKVLREGAVSREEIEQATGKMAG
jgi:L-threonylcarbamoyladenylate synthase